MNCVSGKNAYSSRDLAIEALIQNRIRNFHDDHSGPLNVYECEHCGEWHFTSRKPQADELTDPDVRRRIERERIANDWERKLY